jgi:folate-dependent phosphoribosylglycinamide formyltransferase PurN
MLTVLRILRFVFGYRSLSDKVIMLKVLFISQEDCFVIPQNIERVLKLPGIKTEQIIVVDSKGSMTNRKSIFAEGFGVFQTVHMGTVLLCARLWDAIDSLFSYRLLKLKRSIEAVARKHDVPFQRISNPNADNSVGVIESLDIDLIISYSCPSVFKPRLLKAAKLGCINLHCSLLPKYAGLLPSFWVLYYGEKDAGATVHYMDDKIDNGAILGQCTVPVSPGITMFELIHQTKAAGGALMAEIVERFRDGTVESVPNQVEKESYYTWPTAEEMRTFRHRGGCLI